MLPKGKLVLGPKPAVHITRLLMDSRRVDSPQGTGGGVVNMVFTPWLKSSADRLEPYGMGDVLGSAKVSLIAFSNLGSNSARVLLAGASNFCFVNVSMALIASAQ